MNIYIYVHNILRAWPFAAGPFIVAAGWILMTLEAFWVALDEHLGSILEATCAFELHFGGPGSIWGIAWRHLVALGPARKARMC